MENKEIFSKVINRRESPSNILGYIGENYLDGLNLYQLLKDIPIEELKVEIEYIDNRTIFKVIKKGDKNDSKTTEWVVKK